MAGRNSASFQVPLADGRIRKRHVDHVRIRYPEENAMPSEPIVVEGPSVSSPNGTTQQSQETVRTNGPIVASPQRLDPVPPPRRSGRIRRPPDRLC